MLYLTALQEGLLYGLLALGVYISLRVLDTEPKPLTTWFPARLHLGAAEVGAILGGRVGRRLPARTLGLGFAALLGVTSLAILAQTLTGLITQ